MSGPLAALTSADYVKHPLHSAERSWTETNCYVDVWIEVLHALGLDPRAAGAFTLSTDFEGDQWTFFKFPPEDLRALYGIEVAELNAWRPITHHIVEQLELGRLLTVEVDSFYLPDTQGVSYQLEHVKSTIVATSLDAVEGRMTYFHNSGLYEVSGDDFVGLFGRDGEPATTLPPYVELIRLERMRHDVDALVPIAVELTRSHLARRPDDNPIRRMGKRVADDLGWLQTVDLGTFHQYAFGICRQSGASAALAADFTEWLGPRDGSDLQVATELFTVIADAAKVLQFNLARGARGRRFDIEGPLAQMADAYDGAMNVLSDCYGY